LPEKEVRIGAISAAKSKKAMSQSGNIRTLSLHARPTFDDDAVRRDNEDEQDEVPLSSTDPGPSF